VVKYAKIEKGDDMKMINFKEEVLKRKQALIKDLTGLIQINSELTTFDPNRVGAPFGEGCTDALKYMLEIGKNDGFETVNLDGYAGHIEYGKQKDYVAMIGHLDVVPAGNDWTYPPYGAEIHDGKMYGRGTEDDKGPTVAAYYALKILKELNVPLSKRIKLILGNDEETGWRCVRHYFSVYPETPVSGFIPDADFPLIYAEKGISRTLIKGSYLSDTLIEISGGFRDNMVPDYAYVVIKPIKGLKECYDRFIKQTNYHSEYEKTGKNIKITFHGKSAHGSTPELGQNAIYMLIEFLLTLSLNHQLVDMIAKLLLNDVHGSQLGIAYFDPEMGHLTNNFGVIQAKNGEYQLSLNIRYPNGVDFNMVLKHLEEVFKPYNAQVINDKHQKLIYQDPNSEMIQKLMAIYQKHTGDYESKPITIGGGTFARALPNCIAFGPHFLDKPTFIHQKNEFIDLDDLIKATIIYTEALYELAK
jgi:succinyl-diaminopimelate desuccinylase